MLVTKPHETVAFYSRLEGGAADEDGMSSSGSLDRLRPLRAAAPLFAADILDRSGELKDVSSFLQMQIETLQNWRNTSLPTSSLRGAICLSAAINVDVRRELKSGERSHIEGGRVRALDA